MQIGSPIPASFQLFDCADDKFVRATLKDGLGNSLAVLDLALDANGRYFNYSQNYPNTPFVTCQYIVYDDSGYTMISESEGAGQDTFYLDAPVPNANQLLNATLTGIIDGDISPPPVNGLQDIVIQGEDRTLVVLLLRNANGEAFDLSQTTVVSALFTNADSTILQINSTDGGSPISIVEAGAGKISIALSSAQTTLLMRQNPAPFTIILTTNIGKSICNLFYQLEVQAQAVGP